MTTFTLIDPETIREGIAALIENISPRHLPERSTLWTWLRDQEISGTLRGFDVLIDIEREVPDGAYGGGILYTAPMEIRISYPVSESMRPRIIGADAQDIAATLIRAHDSIPGMFPTSVRGSEPISEIAYTGESGRFVATLTSQIYFFTSDVVAVLA